MTVAAQSVEVESPVLREDLGAVCRLTLNRPRAYNAMSLALMEAFIAELAEIDRNPAVKVVIVEGAGRGFCAGHDLRELRESPTRERYEATFATCSKLMLAVTRLRQPVIAKVHGVATAAGCQLVATCDLAVAAESARFGTPGVNIGLFCSTPMVALSRAVSRKQAMEMLLTGELMDAEAARAGGLINRTVSEDALEAETLALAEKVASKSGLVLKTGKEAFYRQIDMDLSAAYDYCSGVMTENMTFGDAEEGITAFLEKRDPIWREK